jgi:hypothetical protein
MTPGELRQAVLPGSLDRWLAQHPDAQLFALALPHNWHLWAVDIALGTDTGQPPVVDAAVVLPGWVFSLINPTEVHVADMAAFRATWLPQTAPGGGGRHHSMWEIGARSTTVYAAPSTATTRSAPFLGSPLLARDVHDHPYRRAAQA